MKPHFDIVVFIDCNTLSNSLHGVLHQGKGHDFMHAAHVGANHAQLVVNIHETFRKPPFTYNWIVNACYGPNSPTDPLVLDVLADKPNVYDIRDGRGYDGICNNIEHLLTNLKMGVNYKGNILICGQSLSACVIYRGLGVRAWLDKGWNAYIYKYLVSNSFSEQPEITDDFLTQCYENPDILNHEVPSSAHASDKNVRFVRDTEQYGLYQAELFV